MSSPLRSGAGNVRSEALIDPFFQDVPWDLIYNDNGELIGAVYVLMGIARREGEIRRENHGDRSRNKLRRVVDDAKREAYRFRAPRL